MTQSRYFAHMTTADIDAINKKEGVVILPIGAVEQHGAHLPLLTDTLIANGGLDRTLAQLPDDVKAWALPPMSYGKSNEHINFPGTITLSAATLTAVLNDIASSLTRAGFRRLAFLNGHGGNVALLSMVARDIRVETGMMCFCITGLHYGKPSFEMSDKEWKLGIHGGETETSLILALAPELVEMEKAVKFYIDFPAEDTDLFMFGNAETTWLSEDWSESGIFGDATLGTAEKGEALLAASIENLTKLITVISRFEVGQQKGSLGFNI